MYRTFFVVNELLCDVSLLGQNEEALSQLEFALNLTANNFLISERILTQITEIKKIIKSTKGL